MIWTELNRLRKALGYSWDGLRLAFQQDTPFRLEAVLSAAVIPLALWLGQTDVERCLLLGSWFLVLISELLNCGLEALTDYATQLQRHALAKKTKDVGSAAVLLALVNCAAVWALLLL